MGEPFRAVRNHGSGVAVGCIAGTFAEIVSCRQSGLLLDHYCIIMRTARPILISLGYGCAARYDRKHDERAGNSGISRGARRIQRGSGTATARPARESAALPAF